ncbi:MAG TPA: exodeoxyribonuclease VII small subunit [Bacteroidota bacterium]|nr:exodeoxyribonuclease VII small subunit [Bacteroidota bacterium]
MTTKKIKKESLEGSLARLEEIVDALEHGNVALDDAVALYEEGLSLAKDSADRLKAAELKIKKLSKDIDGKFKVTELDEE